MMDTNIIENKDNNNLKCRNITDLIENKNLNDLKCRICLTTGKKSLKILFNAYFNEYDYSTILYYCTGIKIAVKNSYLPECGICEECEECLIKFYTFKKEFVNSENNFKKNSNESKKNPLKNKFKIKEKPTSVNSNSSDKILNCKIKKYENEIEKEGQYLKIIQKETLEKEIEREEENLKKISERFSFDNKKTITKSIQIKTNPIQIDVSTTENINENSNEISQIVEEIRIKKECDVDLSEIEKLKLTQNISNKEKISCSDRTEVCSICAKNIVRRNMNKHLETHKDYTNDTKPHFCEECGTRFTYKDSLIKHMRVHNNDKRFACSFCGEKFLYWGSRRSHVDRFHTGCRRFTCHLCDKKFFQNSNLTTHIRRFHSGERPYECTECEKKFITRHMLNNHMITHTKEKKHLCEICSKKFGMKKSLKIHLKTHFNQRDYVCSECPRTFTQAHVLRTHMKTHPNIVIPPPGTVLNQSALKRMETTNQPKIINETNASVNVESINESQEKTGLPV